MQSSSPLSDVVVPAAANAAAALAPDPMPPAEPAPLQAAPLDAPALPELTMPVLSRGGALTILAVIAFVFALQWAQKFIIPVVFSILASYTLTPVVAWLERIRIPRLIGVSLLMLSLLGGAAALTNTLHTEFQSILTSLPNAAQKISRAIKKNQGGQPGTMQKIQAAATEIEKAANQDVRGKPGARPVTPNAAPARVPFSLQDWLWAGSMGAAGFIGQATMVLFLTFFLLLSGDSFKRKLVRITGPSLSSKKITVHILDDINRSVQNYMFMLLVTNLLLVLMLWLVFQALGLENAGAWAVAAGFLHIVPYFGSLIIAVATGVTAFMQFDSLTMMFVVAGASMLVAALVGTLITTWMTGRIAKMNTTAVFISLLFWGWLWGVWGLLLGIPIIVMVRVVAEHIDGMQPVAELLGE